MIKDIVKSFTDCGLDSIFEYLYKKSKPLIGPVGVVIGIYGAYKIYDIWNQIQDIKSQNETIKQQNETIKQQNETLKQEKETIKQQKEYLKHKEDNIKKTKDETIIIAREKIIIKMNESLQDALNIPNRYSPWLNVAELSTAITNGIKKLAIQPGVLCVAAPPDSGKSTRAIYLSKYAVDENIYSGMLYIQFPESSHSKKEKFKDLILSTLGIDSNGHDIRLYDIIQKDLSKKIIIIFDRLSYVSTLKDFTATITDLATASITYPLDIIALSQDRNTAINILKANKGRKVYSLIGDSLNDIEKYKLSEESCKNLLCQIDPTICESQYYKNIIELCVTSGTIGFCRNIGNALKEIKNNKQDIISILESQKETANQDNNNWKSFENIFKESQENSYDFIS